MRYYIEKGGLYLKLGCPQYPGIARDTTTPAYWTTKENATGFPLVLAEKRAKRHNARVTE